MGAGPSKTEEKAKEQVYVENIKNFLGSADAETTLRMEDLETDANPKVGGTKPILPTLTELYGGGVGSSSRNRYAQYDVFEELAKLDEEEQQEKAQSGGDGEQVKPTDMKDISSDEAMKQVKETIINHLNSLKAKQAQTAGSCGCDSNLNKKTGGSKSHMLVVGPQRKLYRDDSDTSTTTSDSSASSTSSHTSSSEVGKKKSKSKAKGKGKNKAVDESSSMNFIIDTTESGAEVVEVVEEVKPRRGRTSTRRRRIETSNDDSSSSSDSNGDNDDEPDTEEGLSIFPFNSSDVKSSVSSQNFKTLRRRV